jgi:hypothetical protein
MSKIEVNQISSQCGSTLTIGQSGDTIQLACGATQTGFGRTGTVDWDTTAKTASFTAVSGNGYFVNTTSGAITMTLPATPTAGDIVSIADYAGTAETNNITIARNGSNINGAASDQLINKNNSGITLVYVDGTQGWKATITSNLNDIETQPEYIVATGGTVTCCGDYKIHTFTGPGTFTVCSVGNPVGSSTVDYLVIAGGGGGGAGCSSWNAGGGGGAGGYRESSGAASGCYTRSPLGACVSALPVLVTGYPITVGGGGAGSPGASATGTSGSNSIFNTITSAGGGGAGSQNTDLQLALNGGSGGGGGQADNPNPNYSCGVNKGTGNTPPVSPPQGNPGGNGYVSPVGAADGGGGGGGALCAGGNSISDDDGGPGGAGATSSINGTPTARAGGGGGAGAATGGTGGSGGGGVGNAAGAGRTAGTTNTGGGGGGGGGSTSPTGAAGGSGIVIIRYKYQN